MIMATKNIGVGERITDLREIMRLALEKKSIVQSVRYPDRNYIVRPAAFYVNWSLGMLMGQSLYYTVKL